MISRRPLVPQNRGRVPAGGSTAPEFIFFADGDSLTLGQGSTNPPATGYPGRIAALRPTALVVNDGSGGASAGHMYAEWDTNVRPYGLMPGKKIYAFTEIINDITYGDPNGNVVRLKQLGWRAWQWGFNVIVFTATPTAGFTAPEEAIRVAANNDIRATWTQYADALSDNDVIPQLNPPGSIANPTYFYDPTHLTDAGYVVMGDTIDGQVPAARAAVVQEFPPVIAGNANVVDYYRVDRDFLVELVGGTAASQVVGGHSARQMIQATAAWRPGYSATAWNGTKPGLVFDGTLKFLNHALAGGVSPIDGTNHEFAIAISVRNAANDVAWANWTNSSTGAWTALGSNGAGKTRVFRKDNAGNTATYVGNITLGTTATSRHRIVGTLLGGTIYIYVDGVLDIAIPASTPTTGPAPGAMAFNNMGISGLGGGSAHNGEMVDVFMGSSGWTAAQVARDYAYQKAYWGGLP